MSRECRSNFTTREAAMSEMFDKEKQPVERLDEPISGHCLCGDVSITLTGMAKEVDVCH